MTFINPTIPRSFQVKRDFFTETPSVVLSKSCSYLLPKELLLLSGISRKVKAIVDLPILWIPHCKRDNLITNCRHNLNAKAICVTQQKLLLQYTKFDKLSMECEDPIEFEKMRQIPPSMRELLITYIEKGGNPDVTLAPIEHIEITRVAYLIYQIWKEEEMSSSTVSDDKIKECIQLISNTGFDWMEAQIIQTAALGNDPLVLKMFEKVPTSQTSSLS